jgi:hypothetical protein
MAGGYYALQTYKGSLPMTLRHAHGGDTPFVQAVRVSVWKVGERPVAQLGKPTIPGVSWHGLAGPPPQDEVCCFVNLHVVRDEGQPQPE